MAKKDVRPVRTTRSLWHVMAAISIWRIAELGHACEGRLIAKRRYRARKKVFVQATMALSPEENCLLRISNVAASVGNGGTNVGRFLFARIWGRAIGISSIAAAR